MKTVINIYHYLVILLIVLAIAVFFVMNFNSADLVTAEGAVNLPDGQITGWAWSDTVGWISLNCINVYSGENNNLLTSHCADNGGINYYVSYDAETGFLDGYGWSDNGGWIDFSPGSGYPVVTGDTCQHDPQIDFDSKEICGWAVATYNDADSSNDAWIRFQGDSYEVSWDDGWLKGYAWSGDDAGWGWLSFQPTYSGGPYLQTQYGDIYSGGSVTGSRAPQGSYNATYCIISQQGDNNIKLSSGFDCVVGDVSIDFPSEVASGYRSNNANININSLIASAVQSGTKFVKSGSDYDLSNDLNLSVGNSFNNRVFYFTSDDGLIDWRLGDVYNIIALQFPNGTNGSSGAGTVVIDGNLTINRNIEYATGNPSNLSEIASIAWIVLGDVYIDPQVTQIAGTFIVVGSSDRLENPGIFDTANGLDQGLQLNIIGTVAAKSISLDRVYFENLSAAEIFTYDGRVLTNTPPGLSNFAGYLPKWN